MQRRTGKRLETNMTDAIVNSYGWLSRATKVPSQLLWHSFDRTCSRALKTDREIFLQRLELGDFEEFHKNRYIAYHRSFGMTNKSCSRLFQRTASPGRASQELNSDREVVMAVIQNSQSSAPQTIQYASTKLKGDR
jgi:hypothetical protein